MMPDQPQPSFRQSKIRLLLVLPIFVTILSAYILVNTYMTTGDWFQKSIELKGGSLITIVVDKPLDLNNLQSDLSARVGKVSVTQITGIKGREVSIESASEKTESILSELKGMGVDIGKSSVKIVGTSLSSAFWQQVQIGLAVALILMGFVVFIMYRTFAPSMAVILAAFLDIFMTLAFMQVFGIELSLSSFAAILMLIGYSVDTDILQTSRILNRKTEAIKERFTGAFKTGMTMTLTTIAVLIVLQIAAISPVLTQIASVLLIGLVIDMMNTWITNAAILRWYVEKKGGFV